MLLSGTHSGRAGAGALAAASCRGGAECSGAAGEAGAEAGAALNTRQRGISSTDGGARAGIGGTAGRAAALKYAVWRSGTIGGSCTAGSAGTGSGGAGIGAGTGTASGTGSGTVGPGDGSKAGSAGNDAGSRVGAGSGGTAGSASLGTGTLMGSVVTAWFPGGRDGGVTGIHAPGLSCHSSQFRPCCPQIVFFASATTTGVSCVCHPVAAGSGALVCCVAKGI